MVPDYLVARFILGFVVALIAPVGDKGYGTGCRESLGPSFGNDFPVFYREFLPFKGRGPRRAPFSAIR